MGKQVEEALSEERSLEETIKVTLRLNTGLQIKWDYLSDLFYDDFEKILFLVFFL